MEYFITRDILKKTLFPQAYCFRKAVNVQFPKWGWTALSYIKISLVVRSLHQYLSFEDHALTEMVRCEADIQVKTGGLQQLGFRCTVHQEHKLMPRKNHKACMYPECSMNLQMNVQGDNHADDLGLNLKAGHQRPSCPFSRSYFLCSFSAPKAKKRHNFDVTKSSRHKR